MKLHFYNIIWSSIIIISWEWTLPYFVGFTNIFFIYYHTLLHGPTFVDTSFQLNPGIYYLVHHRDSSYRSFSLGVLCLGAEREAACVVCLDTPPKHRLLFFGADCTQITYLIGALLICVRSESSIQQALFRRGIQADDASRFSFCKYTEGKASIGFESASLFNFFFLIKFFIFFKQRKSPLMYRAKLQYILI